MVAGVVQDVAGCREDAVSWSKGEACWSVQDGAGDAEHAAPKNGDDYYFLFIIHTINSWLRETQSLPIQFYSMFKSLTLTWIWTCYGCCCVTLRSEDWPMRREYYEYWPMRPIDITLRGLLLSSLSHGRPVATAGNTEPQLRSGQWAEERGADTRS